MNISIRTMVASAVTTSCLAVGLLALPQAHAITPYNSSGGTACKGASGFGAQLFYFTNQYVQNTSSSGQYVSCDFPALGNVGSGTDANAMNIGLANPTGATISFTCVVQAGTDGYGTTNSATATKDVLAGSTMTSIYLHGSSTPVIPASPNNFASYTISCLVPSQGKINMINIWSPT